MTRAAANQLLDYVRAGGEAPESEILFALLATGDYVICPISRKEEAT